MTRDELTKEEQTVLDALRSFSGSDRSAAEEMIRNILSGRSERHTKVDAPKNGTGKQWS